MAKRQKEKSDLFYNNTRRGWKACESIELWVRCGGQCTMCHEGLLRSSLVVFLRVCLKSVDFEVTMQS